MRYIRQRSWAVCVFVLFFIIFAVSFALYHLPLAAVLYPAALCLILAAGAAVLDFFRVRKRHVQLEGMLGLPAALINNLPEAGSLEAEDYQRLILRLKEEQAQLLTQTASQYADLTDYYTVWAHQIKTPIASMQLKLQGEDSEFARGLASDLFRIEQYTEMAMAFVRLGSDTTDYVFRQYDLDGIIRQCIKRFAGDFISRRIWLEYEPIHRTVVTDEKWLCFVIEQLLSNALKYTRCGSVKIYMREPLTLCIEDTGIGIAPEDLPRVFDKGYTGYNGRSDKKASGLGLYLCRSICRRLGHNISAISQPDVGTVIFLDLKQYPFEKE